MMEFRTGSHNARNIYIKGANRDTDIHAGVMFEPEMAKIVVTALNEYFKNKNFEAEGKHSAYIYFTEDAIGIEHTREIAEGIHIDYDKDHEIVGLEALDVTRIDINGKEVFRG